MHKLKILCFLAFTVTILAVTACVPGRVITKKFDFNDFDQIEIGSAFEVKISCSSEFSVTVTAGENIFRHLVIEKQGRVLRIMQTGGSSIVWAAKRAEIKLPEITSLTLSEASRGELSNFSSSGDLSLNVSGASNLKLTKMETGNATVVVSGTSKLEGQLKCGDIDFELSGVSRLELVGSGKATFLKVSGASSADLADFLTTSARVNLSGASNATVKTDGNLDMDLSGASRLYYIGNPTINTINISGGSTVQKK